jgi:glycolate oxidase iron-sulfur subunit
MTPHATGKEAAVETLLRYEHSLDCVHCGLCLPVCPTYRLTGKESASPRGRIYLMRAFAEKRLEESASSILEVDRCLVCRACETVCPSGVQFGEMMELTRDLLEPTGARGRLARALTRGFVRDVLASPRRVRALASLLRLYRESGLRFALRKLGVLHLFGRGLVQRDDLLPSIPPRAERGDPPVVTPACGPRRARVGFLVGCIAHELLPRANRASIEVLAKNGCEVVCPKSRPCCGALPMHFGDLEAARRLARATIDAFDDPAAGPLDAVVVSSAGCGSAMKDYHRLLEHDAAYAEKAKRFSARLKDWNEYLAALPLVPPTGRLDLRVAYSEPCHLVHAQRISAAPKALLQAIPGVQLVPFVGSDSCCGAAGLYSVTQPEQSVALLDAKMEQLALARPDVIVTANPGCHLQLKSGAADSMPAVEVLHVAELLARAYESTAIPTAAARPDSGALR